MFTDTRVVLRYMKVLIGLITELQCFGCQKRFWVVRRLLMDGDRTMDGRCYEVRFYIKLTAIRSSKPAHVLDHIHGKADGFLIKHSSVRYPSCCGDSTIIYSVRALAPLPAAELRPIRPSTSSVPNLLLRAIECEPSRYLNLWYRANFTCITRGVATVQTNPCKTKFSQSISAANHMSTVSMPSRCLVEARKISRTMPPHHDFRKPSIRY